MYLYGASGHGKVVIDILELLGLPVEGLFDDDESIKTLLGFPVNRFLPPFERSNKMIISIGQNINRKRIASVVNAEYGVAIHPRANFSSRSSIDAGSVVMAGASINANVRIGKHCIVNTNSSVDHDCILEDFVHISPNVALCGNVQIGEGTLIGTGTAIIPGKKVGKWCVVGAGAVVIKDIPDYSVVAGNPATTIKNNAKEMFNL